MVRILGILGALLEGGQPSITQLAARFGTRRETIYRDIRALEDAGYPIAGDDRGRLSHPRLLPDARRHAPELRLTDSEIAALLWASAQTASKSPFRESLSTAQSKLRAMATPGQADITRGIGTVVAEGGWGAKDYGSHRGTILKLVEAIVGRRRCTVDYQSPAASVARRYEYDPYRLLAVGGGLYCIGRVPPHKGVTTLAVERIQAVSLLQVVFEVATDFDAERYRRESFGIIWEKPANVVIRFTADQAPYVREREWHPTQCLRGLRGGGVELSFRAGGMFEIARWVLGWGENAEVIKPVRLRSAVAEALARAAASYR